MDHLTTYNQDYIYTDYYYKKFNYDLEDNTYNTHHMKIECGKFTVKYDITIDIPLNSFGLECWKTINKRQIEISFYENDQLLFTKDGITQSCLIIHTLDSNNQTKENTFFSIREGYTINIYDMNNKFIREATIGPDCIVDFRRVNEKYAISLTEEMCTYSPFTGLFDLNQFFNQLSDDEQLKPYDNSRVAIPLRSYYQMDHELKYFPLAFTKDGFILEDLRTNEILTEIIPYDKVYNEEISFYDDEKESQSTQITNILINAGFNMDKINQQLIDKGQVYIDVKDIPNDVLNMVNKLN